MSTSALKEFRCTTWWTAEQWNQTEWYDIWQRGGCLMPLPDGGFDHEPLHSPAAGHNVCWCMAVCTRAVPMWVQSDRCMYVSTHTHLSRAVHHRGTCRDSALCRTATTVLMCERELGSCWWMNLHFSSSESLISLLALNLSLPHPFPFPLYKAGSPSSWRWELFSCFKSQFENVRVQILERKVWVLKARMFFLIRVMPSSREKPLCFYSSSVLVPKPFIWSD